MTDNTKKLEDTDSEFAARLKGDIDNLSPEARQYCREVLSTLDKPKEEPKPDYSSMTEGEFAAMKAKLLR